MRAGNLNLWMIVFLLLLILLPTSHFPLSTFFLSHSKILLAILYGYVQGLQNILFSFAPLRLCVESFSVVYIVNGRRTGRGHHHNRYAARRPGRLLWLWESEYSRDRSNREGGPPFQKRYIPCAAHTTISHQSVHGFVSIRTWCS